MPPQLNQINMAVFEFLVNREDAIREYIGLLLTDYHDVESAIKKYANSHSSHLVEYLKTRITEDRQPWKSHFYDSDGVEYGTEVPDDFKEKYCKRRIIDELSEWTFTPYRKYA